MNFTRIDLNTWNRREHFALYRQQIKCGFIRMCWRKTSCKPVRWKLI
ncbi:hypothetical protein CQA78_29925 [Klebsiella pneumoniae]|nr:hypothetical protein CQA78_29925 [Klebsiella pneumoniae]